MPKASIIILNWNGKHLLKECLDSVFAQSFKEFEVILVDNGSADGSVEFVKKNYPKARVIAEKQNVGFAEGNNIGIKASKGEYAVLLNNDTRAHKSWLRELVAAADSDPSIGICGSKVLFYGTRRINSLGHVLYRNGVMYDLGLYEQDRGQYDRPRYLVGACAVAALYRRSMLDAVSKGGEYLDRDFYAYYEDADLNLRAYNAGWKALYVPAAVVEHKLSASTSSSAWKAYFTMRNRFWFLLKNFSAADLVLNAPFVLAYALVEAAYFALLKAAPTTIARAYVDSALGIPRMLKKRAFSRGLRKGLPKEKAVPLYSGTGLSLIAKRFSRM